jgi:hypothetical protein
MTRSLTKWSTCILVALTTTVSLAQEAEEPLEPDYAVVAADARKIADEILERAIPAHMLDAESFLNKFDGVAGHPKANEAYLDMEEMIGFCESMGGKAKEACRFKLSISMGKPGDTLGQLGRGMKPGQGSMGGIGQGSAGQSGGSIPYSVFGPASMSSKNRTSSRLGDKKGESDSANDGVPDPMAGNVDELNAEKNFDTDFSAGGSDRIIEEYRGLIRQYFKRLAEEGE